MDDVTPEEWMKKAENAEEEYKIDPEKDSQAEQNRKETMARYQNKMKFTFDKRFFTRSGDVLNNAEKLKDFINNSM